MKGRRVGIDVRAREEAAGSRKASEVLLERVRPTATALKSRLEVMPFNRV